MPDWAPFVEFVKSHQHFLITTHVRPDGDALGSQLALGAALESLGKKVSRVIASPMPERYRFLDPKNQVEVYAPPAEHLKACDAIVVVDTGTWNQLASFAEFVRASSADKFVVDHHQTQDDLGGARLVDTSAEACGRLIHDAIRALDVRLTPDISRLLFTALSTDTGWFRHQNTTAWTFALAGELVAAGADPNPVYEQIYEAHPMRRLRLFGRSLEKMQTLLDGQLAYTTILQSDLNETGAVPLDTEDLINFPRSLAGAELALLFIEQPDKQIKVSFRSKHHVDVAALAEQFNGGGHRRAAGATLTGPVDAARDRVLAAATKALGEARS